jgi:hypothetical protein
LFDKHFIPAAESGSEFTEVGFELGYSAGDLGEGEGCGVECRNCVDEIVCFVDDDDVACEIEAEGFAGGLL